MLDLVKTNLGITGNYQDEAIQGYINEVKAFLIDGGISESVVNSNEVAGLISIGVKDLWNYGSGKSELSPYFFQRVEQLKGGLKNEL